MDILNMSIKEIEELEYSDYLRAVRYSWTAFNLRRTDLPLRGDKDKDKDVLIFDQSELLKKKVEQLRQKKLEKAHNN